MQLLNYFLTPLNIGQLFLNLSLLSREFDYLALDLDDLSVEIDVSQLLNQRSDLLCIIDNAHRLPPVMANGRTSPVALYVYLSAVWCICLFGGLQPKKGLRNHLGDKYFHCACCTFYLLVRRLRGGTVNQLGSEAIAVVEELRRDQI